MLCRPFPRPPCPENDMHTLRWRLAAWAALAAGLVAGPALAAPPKTGQTTTPGHTTTTGTTGQTTNLGHLTTPGTTGQQGTGAGTTNQAIHGAAQANAKAKADTAMGLLHDAQHAVS